MTARTVGVEEEFLLFRGRGTELAGAGDEVAAAASRDDADGQFEHELKQAQTELGSAPASSLDSLAADLTTLRRELAQAATERGLRLVASATSPILTPAPTTEEPRYQAMTADYGHVGRQQLTCGMHMHVSVESDEEGVRVIDGLAPWLPVLTALSSNSPFYAGEDTGYASYRSVLWGQWPTAGPTAAFGDAATYRTLREQLVALGAARDDAMIYFDARLSQSYPTVEVRVCDVCATPADSVVIAGLTRALVSWAAGAAPARSPRPELLRAASWRAARWGMNGSLVDLGSASDPRLVPAWDLVDALVDLVGEQLAETGDLSLVTGGVAEIRRRGTGAELQRSVHTRTADFDSVLDRLTVAATDATDAADAAPR